MSTRSKFERRLGFRDAGFAIKIPDVGRSLKPFDYVVGVPITVDGARMLRFAAIEAKTATGWTLRTDAILPHQRKALNLAESLAPYSAWLAVGFLDMPKMTLDWNRQKLASKMKAEAYLLWWKDSLYLEREYGGIRYRDIIRHFGNSKMGYMKIGSAYKWVPARSGAFYDLVSRANM